MRAAAPAATESITWAPPVYDLNGPTIFIKAHTIASTSDSGVAVSYGVPAACWKGSGIIAGQFPFVRSPRTFLTRF